MNAICSFRKCTLSDDELIKKVDEATDSIYKHGKIPTRHIPAQPNSDFDLLIGELLLRFNDLKASNSVATNPEVRSKQLKADLYLFRDMYCQNIDLSTIDEYVDGLSTTTPMSSSKDE